ncbi:MAG: transposase [Candidatus Omnitrophota bacterium]
MKEYKTRKLNRLKEYDYSQAGYYYVTICVYVRECLFGNIINNNMELNNAGEMMGKILQKLPEYYPNIDIDQQIVMPNHIHAIIIIKEPVGDDLCVVPGQNQKHDQTINQNDLTAEGQVYGNGQTQDKGRIRRSAPTGRLSLSNIIQRFKMITTKRYIDGVKNYHWQTFDKHLWQRSFYDHIIRTNDSLNNMREYIVNNPSTWDNDEHNINNFFIEDNYCKII